MSIKVHAVRFHKTGGVEVLQNETVELDEPGPGEVRMRHTAIGVNYAEVYQRTGHYPMPLPSGIGNEAAGVVEALGPGVTGLAAGDRVCYGGGTTGSYATHRNIAAARLVRTPDDISDEVAAASLLKGMTVEYLLNRCHPIKKGQDVLFYAASGGVGCIAGQWGRYLGARMIGVAGGSDKCKLALSNGYDTVIDRTREDIVARVKELTGGKGVPVAYDSVGKATFQTTLDCLAPRGMFVSFGTTSGPVPPLEAATLQKMGSLYFTRPTLATYAASREDLELSSKAVFQLIERGVLKLNIKARYSLSDVRRCHEDLEGGRTVGSSIIIP